MSYDVLLEWSLFRVTVLLFLLSIFLSLFKIFLLIHRVDEICVRLNFS